MDAPPKSSSHKASVPVDQPGDWIWFLPLGALGLFFVAFSAWWAMLRVDAGLAGAIFATNTALVVGGKLAAIPVGLGAGAPPVLVSTYVLVGDLLALFLFFPFTQVGVDKWLVKSPRLGRWILRMQETAGRSRIVGRWGPVGLYFLAMIPFSLNSPILDAFIGRLAGLRTWQIITPLLAEMIIMNAVYTTLFVAGFARFGDALHGPRVLLIVGSVVIAVGLIVGLARAARARRRARATPPSETATA